MIQKQCFEGYFAYENDKLEIPFIRQVSQYNPNNCDKILVDAYTVFAKFDYCFIMGINITLQKD